MKYLINIRILHHTLVSAAAFFSLLVSNAIIADTSTVDDYLSAWLIADHKDYNLEVHDMLPSELLDDLQVLKYFIKHGYGGYVYQFKSEAELDALLTSIESEIKNQSKWASRDFAALLYKHLSTKVRDGHFSIVAAAEKKILRPFDAYSLSTPKFAYIAEPAQLTKSCIDTLYVDKLDKQNIMQVTKITQHDVFITASPLDDTNECVNLKGQNGEFSNQKLTPLFTDGSVYPITKPIQHGEIDANTYFISIASFSNLSLQIIEDIKNAALSAKRYAKVILDLSRNGGGNPNRFFVFLEALGASGTLTFDGGSYIDSFAVNALAYRFASNQIEQIEEPEVKAQFQAIKDKLEIDLEKAINGDEFYTFSKVDIPSNSVILNGDFKGSLTVITGPGCYSACEVASLWVRQLKNTTVLGSNTAGVLHFGDPLPLQLPNSKVRVHIPIQEFLSTRSGFYESRGVDPQIWMDRKTQENWGILFKLALEGK